MAVESTTDRLAMLSSDDFGIAITLFPTLSTERDIVGIFDSDHLEVDLGVSSVSTREPMVMVQTEDVTDVDQDDALIANGITYTVTDIQPDGTGITVLMLNLQ